MNLDGGEMIGSLLIPIAILAALFMAGVRILQEYERGVVFRLGRFAGVKGWSTAWSR
jgi:regulator of protease activity HflC (stomatin/prohibitin superfamily)